METNQQPDWYRTDNAGRIFASLHRWQTTSVYRVSANLTQPVSVDKLEKSLKRVLSRFPYFNVYLRQGFFWCFFEPAKASPPLLPDSIYPCSEFRYRHRQSVPFRVRVYHKRIALEVAHVLTDGTGAITLLRSILADYLGLNEMEPSESDDWFRPDQAPDPEEIEDAFRRYYRPGLPPMERKERAFLVPGKLEPRGTRHITTGIFQTSDLLALSRSKSSTLGEFIIATYLFSLLQVYYDLPAAERKRKARPIRLDIPVNLRTHLPSKSMRNFFLPTYPEIDPRLGEYTFEETLHTVRHFMKSVLMEKYFLQMIGRNVGAAQHPLLRSVPLFIKHIILPEIYTRFSLSQATSSLSNLGKVTMPGSVQHLVERFDFVPTHPSNRGISCGMISYHDRLHICFNRILTEPTVERIFFRNLSQMGVMPRIESNQLSPKRT